MLRVVRHEIPLIVIAGSGRLASQVRHVTALPLLCQQCPSYDLFVACVPQLAGYVRAREEDPESFNLASVADNDIREVLRRGHLYLCDVSATFQELQGLIVAIVRHQREVLLRTLAGVGTDEDSDSSDEGRGGGRRSAAASSVSETSAHARVGGESLANAADVGGAAAGDKSSGGVAAARLARAGDEESDDDVGGGGDEESVRVIHSIHSKRLMESM